MGSELSKIAGLLRVAEMYYILGMGQDEIARSMSISRSTVSRMLDRARREGLVEIHVADPFSRREGLEKDMRDMYGVKNCVVVPSYGRERREGNLSRVVGIAAADHVKKAILPSAKTVGLGWGETLEELVGALDGAGDFGTELVPLIGGMEGLAAESQVNVLCGRMSESVNGKSHTLYAPALVASVDVKRGLCESEGIRSIMGMWQRLDAAIVEVYPFSASLPVLPTNYFDEKQVLRLLKAKTVGDVCCVFFDITGKESYQEMSLTKIGIEMEGLCNTPTVVAVASGEDRARAVVGALRAGFIDTLIVDERLATATLSEPKKGTSRSARSG